MRGLLSSLTGLGFTFAWGYAVQIHLLCGRETAVLKPPQSGRFATPTRLITARSVWTAAESGARRRFRNRPTRWNRQAKALSPLRSASAVHNADRIAAVHFIRAFDFENAFWKICRANGLDGFGDWMATTMARLWRWNWRVNPNGIQSFSPRLRLRRYLGFAFYKNFNAKGVASPGMRGMIQSLQD